MSGDSFQDIQHDTPPSLLWLLIVVTLLAECAVFAAIVTLAVRMMGFEV